MNNYLNKLRGSSDPLIRIQVMTMQRQIRILGTDIIVESYDNTTDYSSAFGTSFQTDNFMKSGSKSRTERIIINKQRLMDHYRKMGDPISVYHYNPIFNIGDVVSFTEDNILYKFKVDVKQSYGLSPHILYRWELIGLPEDTSNASGGYVNMNKKGNKSSDIDSPIGGEAPTTCPS